jgi:hypothetical protein
MLPRKLPSFGTLQIQSRTKLDIFKGQGDFEKEGRRGYIFGSSVFYSLAGILLCLLKTN